MPTKYAYKVTNNYKAAATFSIQVGEAPDKDVEYLLKDKSVNGTGSGNTDSAVVELDDSPKYFIKATVDGVDKCLDTTDRHDQSNSKTKIKNEVYEVRVSYSSMKVIEITAWDAKGNRIAKGGSACPEAALQQVQGSAAGSEGG